MHRLYHERETSWQQVCWQSRLVSLALRHPGGKTYRALLYPPRQRTGNREGSGVCSHQQLLVKDGRPAAARQAPQRAGPPARICSRRGPRRRAGAARLAGAAIRSVARAAVRGFAGAAVRGCRWGCRLRTCWGCHPPAGARSGGCWPSFPAASSGAAAHRTTPLLCQGWNMSWWSVSATAR